MTTDAYVQVASDGSGKKISMDQATDAGSNVVYLQRALLVGDPADALASLVTISLQQLSLLRVIARILSETSNSRVSEDDFSQINDFANNQE